MFKRHLFACCEGDSLLYECFIFPGHVFRRYPNGYIKAASSEDKEAAAYFIEWHNRRR